MRDMFSSQKSIFGVNDRGKVAFGFASELCFPWQQIAPIDLQCDKLEKTKSSKKPQSPEV